MRHNHRRIKQSRIRTIHACQRTVTKDSEGVPEITYTAPYSLKAEVWPAGGRLQVEQYGDRISDITNLRIQGQYEVFRDGSAYGIQFSDGHTLTIGDGIFIDSEPTLPTGATGATGATGETGTTGGAEEPDYSVLSITPYYPVKVEAKRL